MFRSLRTRLIAAYVFAAIVLVFVAAVGVTAFALSTFGITVRESIAGVVRAAPEEALSELPRYNGSLKAAAPDIVRHLVRPGLHVAVIGVDKNGQRHMYARGDADQPDGSIHVLTNADFGPGGGTFFRLDGRVPRLGGGGRSFQMQSPPSFPFGLNSFLHVEPQIAKIPGGVVSVWPIPSQLERFINQFWIAMIPVGIIVVLGAWLMGRYITNQALRPLVETTASLNRFARGDFTPRAIVTSDRGEIGDLVTAYNGAAAQVSAAFEERKSVETQMRQFVADAGHELRTPLTVVMGFIDVLRRRSNGDSATSSRIYDTMLHESRRMRTLIDKLISLARLENPQQRETLPVDVADVAEHVVGALQALQTRPRVTLTAEHGLVVEADEHEIHEAISNLVDNALKYAPLSPVDVKVGSEGRSVVVEVADRGPGLDEADRAHIFDRFYRGENRGDVEGSGLGLAIVKRAVERAGGEIDVESTPGHGTRFTIRLPRRMPGDESRIAV
jgi:two-component system OmpR family sensor kinase